MPTMAKAVENFLAQKRIAVAGVSRNGEEAANAIYQKLCDTGYEVFAVNPHADEIKGEKCYRNLADIPGQVDGVVISTSPQVTAQIVRQCAELGIPRVWMHRSFGQGSVSDEAVEFCRANNIAVIPGGCPMMYCGPVDFGHKCIRWFLSLTGGLPKEAG